MAACLNRLERYGRTMGVSECFRARVIRVQPSSLKVQSRRLSKRLSDLVAVAFSTLRLDPIESGVRPKGLHTKRCESIQSAKKKKKKKAVRVDPID